MTDKSIFSRLKKLFSTDVIVRNVGGKKLKIVDTDALQYGTDRNSLRDRFNRLRSTSTNTLHARDMMMSYQSARLEIFRDYDCIGPDTIIPLPDGTRPTIKELAEKYKNDPMKRFYVFSYDHKTDSIKLGLGRHPRKKGPRIGYKVIFENGQYVIGSAKHPFLMRNGEYKRIKELKVGESVMPFYQKDFYKEGYRHLYNFSNGWQSEHRIVAEQFCRPLNENEIVHHCNFDKTNNLPENLKIMKKSDHSSFHRKITNEILWSPENREKTLERMINSDGYKNRKCHRWNGERSGDNNPFYGKLHTKESNSLRSDTLKEIFKDRDQTTKKNPNFREDLTFDALKFKASEHYKNNGKLNLQEFTKDVGCDYSTIQSRLKNNNYDWATFKEEVVSTLNHKIKSIERIGKIDVYDVTVDDYHNFATDSCFVKNTMDMDPVLCSALDIYADECTTENEMGNILTINSSDENIKKILENLFYDILNIQFNLWSWVRNICKYGDFFLKLEISPEYGIYLVRPMSAYEVTRVENSDPNNANYIKFKHDGAYGGGEYENFEVAHFRLISDSNFLPYGKSMVEGARRVWKQLSLMEDAMLIHRIMRAPEKRIFKVDIGNIPPSEVDGFMEKMITKIKKVPYLDERTGDYNLRFNLQNMIEDFYLPVRGGDSGTSIESLPGMEFTGTEDIEYLRNKMMAALKIPKAFLGYEEGLSGKATLAAEDVRFARTITRIQKIIISELTKIAVVHLFVQGFKDASLVDFSLELTNPSTIFEQEKIGIWSDKMGLVKDMVDAKIFSRDWIYENVFGISELDAEEIKQQVVADLKETYRFKQIEEEGNDPAESRQKVDSEGNLVDVEDAGEAGTGAGDMGGPEEEPIGGGAGEEAGGIPPPPLEEERKPGTKLSREELRKRREYKRRKFPRGSEDLLGKAERDTTARQLTDPIKHKFRGGSPLALSELELLSKKFPVKKKEVLAEVTEEKTIKMLDENNIDVETKNINPSSSMLDEKNIYTKI